jgi:predicted RNA-binding protein
MKITLEYSMKLNPRLNPELFLPDPKQVLKKLDETPIKDWLEFISKEYKIQKVKNLILIPCSFYKPYDPPHDEFYRRINELRKKAKDTKFITVSVPLALEPEEYWSFQWKGYNLIYDCPFFPWIKNFGYKWDEEVEKKVFVKLESVIKRFFERNRENVEEAYAFFVPGSFEARLIKDHVDHFVLNEDPKIEVSYDNNTSEVYCHPKVWKKFEDFLKGNGIC